MSKAYDPNKPTVFECWQSPSELTLTVTTPEQARKMKAAGTIEADSEPLYSLRGTWGEVMAAHHEIQEWEPYKPF